MVHRDAMFTKFLFGQLDDVRPAMRKFLALERAAEEIHPVDFVGDKNSFRMLTANDDPLKQKKP